MGTGCGLNNNSCSGTFKFKLQSGKNEDNITTDFLGLLLRNYYCSFTRGHDPKEDVTIHDNIISIEFEFNLENDQDPKGEDGLYVGDGGGWVDDPFNFNEIILSIIDFGGIPLVKYGLTNTDGKKMGAQFSGYIGHIEADGNSNPPLIRADTTLSLSFALKPWLVGGNREIGGWNTSSVTDMSEMFNSAGNFNQDIGGWNTSNVTDMSNMFNGAISFDKNIGGWVTSKVTDMEGMFAGAIKFNQDIGGWDTSKVTNMNKMFKFAIKFDQNIGEWDTSMVGMIGMYYMFQNASSFDKDLSGWCVTNITSEPYKFYENSSIPLLSLPVWGTCP